LVGNVGGERGVQDSQRHCQDGTAASRRDSSGLHQGNQITWPTSHRGMVWEYVRFFCGHLRSRGRGTFLHTHGLLLRLTWFQLGFITLSVQFGSIFSL
jgi:hypothetical protein